MGSPDRTVQKEDQSIWNSRLFKGGLMAAAVGFLIDSQALMAVGVIAAGGALAWWKGKS